MPKMRAVQVAKKNAPFELVERELPQPGLGEVRIKVQACGVCHSDSIAKEGLFPSVRFPIVPGHEIAGVIDAVDHGVIGWKVGMRVGVGWFGGHWVDASRAGAAISQIAATCAFPASTTMAATPRRWSHRRTRWR